MLDLDFSPEQEMLRESVRGVIASNCPISVVRELEDDATGYSTELWAQMGKLDLIGLLLPETAGGSQMSLVEGVVLYEELGRSLAPTPHFVSAFVVGTLLARYGSDDQHRVLESIVTGQRVDSLAWLEPNGGYGPAGVQLTATPSGSGFVLDGVKHLVPFAQAAGAVVVVARSGAGLRDIDLFVVPTDSAGLRLSQQLTIASDSVYELRFDQVSVDATARLGPAGQGWPALSEVLNEGLVLLAAQAIAGARQALDLAVQYAKDRHQFDKPLGAFQALAHYLADAVTRVDGVEQLVHEAAWAHGAGLPIDRLAPMAKLMATRTYRDVTAMAQQLFGGVGFTLDFDIQLHFRRAKAQQLSWFDPRALEEMVASAVLD